MRWRPAAGPGVQLGRPRLRRSRRLLYWLESLGLRLMLIVLGVLPLDLVSAMGGRLARAIGPRLPVSRVGRDNLRQALPEKKPAEIEAVLRGVWDNLGRTVAEYPHLLRICDYHLFDDRPPAWPRIEIVGLEHLVDLGLDGRPGLFFSGHLANWELPPIGALDNGLAVAVLLRPPNNPYAAKLVHQLRSAAGARLLPTTMDSALAAVELLQRGGHLGLLVDQHFGRGVTVPFFGRPVQVPATLAKLAYRFDCPVHGTRVERLGRARFRITVTPPLVLPRSGDTRADVVALMAEVMAILESWVRERPDQWLWLHRRWRS
jgi:Kdo2-lipid IVA lauroyltransferase/acyltransferase